MERSKELLFLQNPLQPSDTVGTSYSDAAGKFLISGLPGGTYVLSFSPNIKYLSTEKSIVQVTVGSITDVGTVTRDLD